jgi:hypothetical protein
MSLFITLRAIRSCAVQELKVDCIDFLTGNPELNHKAFFTLQLVDTKNARRIYWRTFPMLFARIITHYIDHIRPVSLRNDLFVEACGKPIINYTSFMQHYYTGTQDYVGNLLQRGGCETELNSGVIKKSVDQLSSTFEHNARTRERYLSKDVEEAAVHRLQLELEGQLTSFRDKIPDWWLSLMYPCLLALREEKNKSV